MRPAFEGDLRGVAMGKTGPSGGVASQSRISTVVSATTAAVEAARLARASSSPKSSGADVGIVQGKRLSAGATVEERRTSRGFALAVYGESPSASGLGVGRPSAVVCCAQRQQKRCSPVCPISVASAPAPGHEQGSRAVGDEASSPAPSGISG
jgi:hypothetical protein